MTYYAVRFRGHLCAAVKTGFARKTILVRARKGEESFRSDFDPIYETEVRRENEMAVYDGAHRGHPDLERARVNADRLARLECARAIKRTEEARKRLALLVAGSTLAGETIPKIKSAARLMADSKLGAPTRRGKRWKIVRFEGDKKVCKPDNNPL